MNNIYIQNTLHYAKIAYQLFFFLKNKDLQVDHHAGGKWFIHGLKRHKENQFQSLELPCWLVMKSYYL